MATKKAPRTVKEWRFDLTIYICVGLLLLGVGVLALTNGGSAPFGSLMLAIGAGIVLFSTLKWTSLPSGQRGN